jgi:hypothetical protein
MEKPEFLPSLAEHLVAAGIRPTVLGMAIADYLENVAEVMKVDYNHYQDPFSWLQAEEYRQRIDAFSKLLNADDTTGIDEPTQESEGEFGTASDEATGKAGNRSRPNGSRTDLPSVGQLRSGSRRGATSDESGRKSTRSGGR